MKSFDMLQTGPEDEFVFNRWYIDGKRVSSKEFDHLCRMTGRQDTFHSYRKRGRHFCRSVCYA